MLSRLLLALVALGLQHGEGEVSGCSGAPCDDSLHCRSKWGSCGIGSAWCNADSTWTAHCDATTITTTTIPVAAEEEICSGDAVYLKVRGGSGNHVDVEEDSVQARWNDQGGWQTFVIETKEGAGVIHAGDAVSLRAHTGKHIDVQGDAVQARWKDTGLWQTLTVEKAGDGVIRTNDVICLRAHTGKHIEFGDILAKARFDECGGWQGLKIQLVEARPIHSGDQVFLKAHTGAYIHVEQASVRAAWNEKGDWQAFMIESPESQAVFSGDTIFLKAHTGNLMEVSSSGEVGCRWNEQGLWQSFSIEKENGGPIFPLDAIFLLAHTGKNIDVEGDQVRARWSDHGAWQSLALDQREVGSISSTTSVLHTAPITTFASSTILPSTTVVTTLPPAIDFGSHIEGASIDSMGRLYATHFRGTSDTSVIGNGVGRNIIGQMDLATGSTSAYFTGEANAVFNGMRWDANGRSLYLADVGQGMVLQVDTATMESVAYCGNDAMRSAGVPNDLALTKSGLLYLSGQDWASSTGALWLCRPNGSNSAFAVLLEGAMGRTNGIALSPDDSTLYLTEANGSPVGWAGAPEGQRIWKYSLAVDGSVSDKVEFYNFASDPAVPEASIDSDGMRTDTQGNLYVTRNGAGKITVLSPTGQLIKDLRLSSVTHVTNLAFGGVDGTMIYAVGRCAPASWSTGNGCIDVVEAPFAGREWSWFQASPVTSTRLPLTSRVSLPTTTSAFLAPTTTANIDRCAAESQGCPEPNGQGISAWFTRAMFEEMFPQICNPSCKGCDLLSYNCLIQATLLYPEFANSGSETENKRELAAWLGIMSQETTGGGCSLSKENPDGSCTCGPMWCDDFPGGGCEAWGLCFLAEDTSNPYCNDNVHYPCVPGKTYNGRGPKQLSYNSNYGQFSEEFCGNKNLLLDHPERVATNPTLAWASSIWFWFTGGACVEEAGERCKPGCHEVLLGSRTKCAADVAAGREYGLGWATNIVNGGLECGSVGRGKCDYRVHSRVKYYKRFCSMLGIDPLAPGWTDDSNLFCHNQQNYAQSPATEC